MQTFAAVILGAVLASLGGFSATQLGIWIDRARRGRDAALLGGEILAAVGTLLRLAEETARLSIPLDRLADDFARYKELCRTGQPQGGQAEDLRNEMEAGFNYLTKSRHLIPGLLALLQPLAHNKFDSYSRIDQDGIPVAKSS